MRLCLVIASFVLVALARPNTCNMQACNSTIYSQDCYGEDGVYCCNGLCTARPNTLSYGTTCTDSNSQGYNTCPSAVCFDKRCDGACDSGWSTGQFGCPCTSNAGCGEGSCEGGKCLSGQKSNGDFCSYNSQCLSGVCDSTSTYRCVSATPATQGQACSSVQACASGLYCKTSSDQQGVGNTLRSRMAEQDVVFHPDHPLANALNTETLRKAMRRTIGLTEYFVALHPATSKAHKTTKGGDISTRDMAYGQGTCMPKAAQGQACGGSNSASGSYSSTDIEICTNPPPPTDYNQCPSGMACQYAQGNVTVPYQCQPVQYSNEGTVPLGGSCATANCIFPNNCESNVCVAPCSLALGATCEHDSSCSSDTCLILTEADDYGKCSTTAADVQNQISHLLKVANGGACDSSEQCAGATSRCVSHVCTEYLGTPCGPATENDLSCGNGDCLCTGGDFHCALSPEFPCLPYSADFSLAAAQYIDGLSVQQRLALLLDPFGGYTSPTLLNKFMDVYCCLGCSTGQAQTDLASIGVSMDCAARTFTVQPQCSATVTGTVVCVGTTSAQAYTSTTGASAANALAVPSAAVALLAAIAVMLF